MRYHICKQTRVYDGEPYCGYSSGDNPAESDDLDEAISMSKDMMKNNPVGWNVFDSMTDKLVYGTDFFKD